MRVTYDPQANAAYIYLAEPPKSGSVRSVPIEQVLPAMIVLDFDANDRLVGVEVLDAAKLLPQELLASATRDSSG